MAGPINGSNGDDTLTGTAGADDIRGKNGDDSLSGLGDDDSIRGGNGNDTLRGGAGDDSLRGEGDNDLIDGGDGADTLLGAWGHDTLIGGDGDDSLDGASGDDSFEGGAGDDMIAGGSGDDSATGGDGADTLDGASGADTLEAGAGDDSVSGGSQNDRIWGDAGADTIDGGSDNDLISGGQGGDSLTGGWGDDSLFGGAGDDTIDAIGGDDWVEGGAGDDLIALGGYSGGADTVVFGPGFGHDTIDGFNPDADVIHVGGAPVGDAIFTPTADPMVWVMTLDGVPDASLTLDFGFYWDSGLTAGDLAGRVINDDDAAIPVDPYAEPICLTAGARVETARGPVPAARLREGDLIRTLDAGLQPVRAVLRRAVTRREMRETPALRPVVIRRGALGGGKPHRTMRVSQQHCFLATAQGGEGAEALIRAKHLADMLSVAHLGGAAVCYVHLLLDAHHLIKADGIWTETVFTGPRALANDPLLAGMLRDRRLPIMSTTARPVLTRRDLRESTDWLIGRRRGPALRRAA